MNKVKIILFDIDGVFINLPYYFSNGKIIILHNPTRIDKTTIVNKIFNDSILMKKMLEY